jgi:hypothetical protein
MSTGEEAFPDGEVGDAESFLHIMVPTAPARRRKNVMIGKKRNAVRGREASTKTVFDTFSELLSILFCSFTKGREITFKGSSIKPKSVGGASFSPVEMPVPD